MGCDIHMILEVKPAKATQFEMVGEMERDGDYISPADRYSGRNYNLFAVLADVRNGSGFAGCDTGDRIEPIAQPRGVPDDASPEYQAWVKQWGVDGHSHSYHTLAQLLDYDWTLAKVSRGFLDLAAYDRWRGYNEKNGNSPDSYCGDVSGGKTTKITRDTADEILDLAPRDYHGRQDWLKDESRAHIYVQCEWTQPSAKTVGNEFWYSVLAPLLKLAKEHGPDNVRAIFFFDN